MNLTQLFDHFQFVHLTDVVLYYQFVMIQYVMLLVEDQFVNEIYLLGGLGYDDLMSQLFLLMNVELMNGLYQILKQLPIQMNKNLV